MTYYADILLAVNFSMNFLVFYLTSKILKKSPSLKRISLGAFISALLSVFSLELSLGDFSSILLSLIILAPSVNFTFKPQSFTEFIKEIFILHASAFLIGGFIFALSNFGGSFIYIGDYGTLTLKHLFLCGFIFLIFIALGRKLLVTYFSERSLCCEVRIHFMGKSVCGTGFIDTGNFLKDPLTGDPVIIAEVHSILNLLPDNTFSKNTIPNTFEDFERIFSLAGIEEKLHILPYKAFGEKEKIIFGFISDFTEITYPNKKIFNIENLVIGITPENFRLPSGAGFLVNPEIFK